MDIDVKKIFYKATTEQTTFYRPTLLLHFLDGDKREVVPTHWHRGQKTSWNAYYVDNNILLNRYPLAAIKEVEIISVEEAVVTVCGDSMWLPIYATTEEVETKIFKKRRFGG